ncbi:MAG TPA: GNAT family N-acetyltransferase [Candidatus Paceibacterota bacterium]|nr:GNAT family N-acetyltransferase [Candidatus Paceibacterota bacterium]
MTIKKAEKNEAKIIAQIHRKSINTGFLSTFGDRFLTKLYEFIISADYCVCYIYRRNNIPVGFICVSLDSKKMYNDFLKKNFYLAIIVFLKNAFSVDRLAKIFDHLFYNSKKRNLPSAELLSVAVIENFKRKKIGSKLFDEAMNYFKKNKINNFVITTGANNIESNEYFKKNKCKLTKRVSIHRNQNSNIYIKKIQ